MLFYESKDAESTALLEEYESVFRWFRHNPRVFVAAFDVDASDEDREFAEEELGVSSLPGLKHFIPKKNRVRTFREALTAARIAAWVTQRTGVAAQRDSPKTILGMQETFNYLHRFHSLASRFLWTDQRGREAIYERMRQNAEELALTAYGVEQSATADLHLRLMEIALEKEWGVAELKNQVRKWKRQISSSGLSAAKKRGLENRVEIYESYYTRIPRIVHFIKTDGRPDNFNLLHYLSVKTAHYWIQPDEILFHASTEPSGPWWERARPLVTLRRADPPYEVNGKQIRLAAHQSDFLRLDYLIKYGGIYLDWDVLTTRPFDDDLMNSTCVFGVERLVPNYKEVMGVAVMMARPNSVFMRRFRDEMRKAFDGDKCYACHSTQLSRDLALQYPEEVRVLNHTSFYHPGWEEHANRLLFDPLMYKEGQEVTPGYGIHMFESHANFQAWGVPSLDVEKMLKEDTHFNHLFRQFITDDMKRLPKGTLRGGKRMYN